MLTLIAAIGWDDVGTVATAVGLSGLLSAYLTARLKRNELRDVWRRDRLTVAVTEYLPAAASLVFLARTAHYAFHDAKGANETPARSEAYVAALDARHARMAEVRRLEIPVLLFIGEQHRAAISAYTYHLDHKFFAAISAPLATFNTDVEEAARLHASAEAAVRADFNIP